VRIGIPKEIKRHEYRVGATPADVRRYVRAGHDVFVEHNAGAGTGFSDDQYRQAGGQVLADPGDLYDRVEMVVKVKEPQEQEYEYFRAGMILYTYLHLAAAPSLAEALLTRGVTAVAYETIQTADGVLPCLVPMSEIAGRLAVQEGAKFLERPFGGRGVLLGGVPGVPAAKVGIIGGGTAGTNAAKIAVGFGARVTILDVSAERMAYLDDIFAGRVETLFSNDENISEILQSCDLVIAAVLIPGASAPKLITRADLTRMIPGAVIVDIAIDQGGCTESSRPTTHDQPVFTVDGIVHYCVANMPAAVPVTSTLALTYRTLPYGLELANNGVARAVAEIPALQCGVNVHNGAITHEAVAKSLGLPFKQLV